MASRAMKKWRFRSQKFQGRLRSSGIIGNDTIVRRVPHGDEKMSQILLDFLSPYTGFIESEDDWHKIVLLGQLAWNAALLPADSRKECLADIFAKSVPSDAIPGFEEVLTSMIERKDEHFAENRRFILGHHWSRRDGRPYLEVLSTMP